MYANKNKMHKNWHNINSKVQVAWDLPEATRGCSMHSATTIPIADVIADRVVIADLPCKLQYCYSTAIAAI